MRKVVNRHTDRETKNNDDCLSSLAEVISWKLYHVRNNWNVFTDKQELIRWLLYRRAGVVYAASVGSVHPIRAVCQNG